MKLNRLATLLLTMALFAGAGQRQTSKNANAHEQSEFGAEDEKWDRPVRVPDAVLEILRSVSSASPDELPAEWLLASEIHLNGPDEIDLIVMGIGGLRGPHAVPFWLFRKTRQGYELVLSTGGDALTVVDATWKGFRKIRVYSNTASTMTTAVYKFNGHEYIRSRELTEPMK